MSSKTASMRSAAWRISLWATLAFACGTMLVFAYMHRFMSNDIQQRSDAWLSGEVEVLGDVAERTPKDALYDRVVKEVAELASREVPNRINTPGQDNDQPNDSVFFLQTGADGAIQLWVGHGSGRPVVQAVRQSRMAPETPTDVHIHGYRIPFRVVSVRTPDGSSIYLGLSERDQRLLLRKIRFHFILLWLSIVLLGFSIVFFVTRRTLGHVRQITEAASRIGQAELKGRVPTSRRNDEVAHLALTLNHMLDRIENSVHQLHTITDALAHDLRSPLTAIRGKLEVYLSAGKRSEQSDGIVAAVDELDRLAEFLNRSLDVAEAKADALRLDRSPIDLDGLLRVMIDLYEPCMQEKGLRVQLRSSGALHLVADAELMHRMIANLFDNELKHLPASCTMTMSLRPEDKMARLMLEDDGPGFAPEVLQSVFEPRARGPHSQGHGLGLAFVEAVVHAHNGTIQANNRESGGARLLIELPLSFKTDQHAAPMALAGHSLSQV